MKTQIETKFRGKRIDNEEWVYGYYYKCLSGLYIGHPRDNGGYEIFQIIPKTLSKQKNYRKFKIWVKHYPI